MEALALGVVAYFVGYWAGIAQQAIGF